MTRLHLAKLLLPLLLLFCLGARAQTFTNYLAVTDAGIYAGDIDHFRRLNRHWAIEYAVLGAPGEQSVPLKAGQVALLARDNIFVRDQVKTVTLSFDYAGNGTPDAFDPIYGYEVPRDSSTLGTRTITRSNGHFTMNFTITPQPDWEMIPIGLLAGEITMKNIVLSSICAPIPEPSSEAMLLAGLGLLGAIARRRRSGGAFTWRGCDWGRSHSR